jgi:hypothetical protein
MVCTALFSVQPYTANEIQQGVAVIETAKRQGVSHFVYSSVGSADEETGIPHFESKATDITTSHSHSMICGYCNTLIFCHKFFLRAVEHRPSDPSGICALDPKQKFRRSAIGSVSRTIAID